MSVSRRSGPVPRFFSVALGLVTTLGLATLAGCGTNSSEASKSTLRSCAIDGLMPYSSSKGGKPGLEIEMADELAKRLDMTNETVWVGSWDGLIPALTSGKCDAIIDGLFITEERKKVVDFTDPTWGSGEVILTKTGDSEISGIQDLVGRCVGVLQGSVTVDHLKKAGVEDLKIYPTQNEVILDLANGGCDAAYLESPSAGWALAQAKNLDLEVVKEYKSDEIFYEGIAVDKSDDALREKLNGAIKEIQKDGTLADILDSYGVPVYLPELKQ